eukprot:SAG11_NODE_23162_length_394_cov_0.644068_1_plen_79_part_10
MKNDLAVRRGGEGRAPHHRAARPHHHLPRDLGPRVAELHQRDADLRQGGALRYCPGRLGGVRFILSMDTGSANMQRRPA